MKSLITIGIANIAYWTLSGEYVTGCGFFGGLIDGIVTTTICASVGVLVGLFLKTRNS